MQTDHSLAIEPKASDLTLGLFVIGLLDFWTIVVFYTVQPVLPANPLELPLDEHNPFPKLLPQGWGFFTRDPKTMGLTGTVRTSAGVWQAAGSTDRRWPRVVEFSRRRKMSGVEVGVILDQLSEPKWQECKQAPTVCLENAAVSDKLDNPMPQPMLCGDVGIFRQPPLPWAWSQAPDETVMPSQVLRVQVVCHD